MATTADHIAARSDGDLIARLIARAEQMGVPDASNWVSLRMGALATQEVETGQTVTDVYAYAHNVRELHIKNTPERPGANLGAVTDEHLRVAIQTVLDSET